MKLTKKQAVKRHRKMWKWLAKQTQKRQDGYLTKEDYFKEHPWLAVPHKRCYLCEYAKERHVDEGKWCDKCPLVWGIPDEGFSSNPNLTEGRDYTPKCFEYDLWVFSLGNWEKRSYTANLIANLPTKKQFRKGKRLGTFNGFSMNFAWQESLANTVARAASHAGAGHTGGGGAGH